MFSSDERQHWQRGCEALRTECPACKWRGTMEVYRDGANRQGYICRQCDSVYEPRDIAAYGRGLEQ